MSFTKKTKLFTGTSRILAISDTHFPYHHADTFRFLRELKAEIQPTMVVQLGDIVDQHTLGRFDPEANAMGTNEELEAAVENVAKLAEIFPSLICTMGNHCTRAFKRINKLGVPSAFVKSLAEVLGTPSGWRFCDYVVIDGIRYLHGDGFMGPTASIKAAEGYRQSCVIGHVHSFGGVIHSAGPSGSIFGMNCGCLIDIDALAFKYNKDSIRKAALGCGAVLGGVPHFLPMGR